MANKEALRELQTRLAERLRDARSQPAGTAWLAVEAAGFGFLLPLAQAGEIFTAGTLVGVPHTREWFSGVANLRGGLFGVVDLARFLGLRDAPAAAPEIGRDQTQLVALNPSLGLNCALKVDRLAGLRNPAQLRPERADDAAPRPAFAGAVYLDAAGRAWQALDLAALAADEFFLGIAA